MAVSTRVLPGTFNFRDLGGLRTTNGMTKPGVLMRSDAPIRLGAEGRRALAAFGVRTAIDLREPIERELDAVDFGALPIGLHAVPILSGGVDVRTPRALPALYHEILETCGTRFAAAARLLGESGATPAIVFCSAGKDRTGILCGLVLSAVGVADDEVVRDYTRSAPAVVGAFRAQLVERARQAGITEQALSVKLGAPAELMTQLLDEVRASHGGAAAYLRRHGLSAGALNRLQRALV